MEKILIKLAPIFCLFVVLNACELTEEIIPTPASPPDEVKTAKAILEWTGPYEVDGCGFFITINGIRYKPKDESKIDDKYKLPYDYGIMSFGTSDVIVEYRLLDEEREVVCFGDHPDSTREDYVEIISIERIEIEEPRPEIFTADAILEWEGDYAVDGCGFFIYIDGTQYKPTNEDIFSDDFKFHGGTEVVIEYKHKVTVHYSCHMLPQVGNGIEILSFQSYID